MTYRQMGGSFAPPLTTEMLANYKSLAANSTDKVKSTMIRLITMLEKFWETPKSTQPGKPHSSGRGQIVPLEEAEIKRIWDFVPWEEELDAYGKIFNTITRPELRNAAYHLLWYGRELRMDREPITRDTI